MVPRREIQANRAGYHTPDTLGQQDMAEVDYDPHTHGYDPVYGAAPAPHSRKWVNVAGALVSVAMLLGAGVWGYRIAVRDVMGIPVIKAMEGPMRVAPENPGGTVTAHQGLSVNDVAAVGVATPLPEEIVLAPRPLDLSDEDVAGLAPEPPPELVAPVAPAAQPPVQPLLATPSAEDAGQMDPLTSVAPLAEADPPAEGEALVLAEPVTVPDAAAAPEFTPPPVVPGGVGASLRPMPRPATIAPPAPSPDAIATAIAAATKEIDASTLPSGTRLVQFGAYDSADQARTEWDKIVGRYGELFADKGRVIQSAESGGRTFYRLRAQGFSDEADARRFCAAITAEGAECIPVTLR
ncbi:sporulation protein [Gemmobacter lanyuensis]|uniref:Sporulation protein n=1 Tax=Gemmobacter lanyuensis TaxID=1054497 RepID=A0A918MGQ0_9RHOB|nr:SPOR domain-containing protein [Gemmobacter lanyuensis]GGW22574.1 sporulation protein [Gemmobacter lanyuensis]